MLERAVIDELMAREGLDEAAAREQGLDVLRLVAARRAELDAREQPPEHPDDLDPDRRNQLERAALVNLWLDEAFEAKHRAADIPKRVIDANMADPSMTRRLFHPRLWFVCQALIVPAEKGEDGRHVEPPAEGEAAEQWRTEAEAALAPLLDRVERFRDDLLADSSCEVFGRMVGTSEHLFESSAGQLALRYERFAFAPSEAESFDPEWVEIVSRHAEPALIEPFTTRFGLHFVIVGKVEDAQLADGSMPEAELEAARRELRDRDRLADPVLDGYPGGDPRPSRGATRPGASAAMTPASKAGSSGEHEDEIDRGVSEFGELLAQLLERTPGSRGVVLSDGVDDTIDMAYRPAMISKLDVCITGAQIGQPLSRLNISTIIFGLGRAVILLEAEDSVLLCKVLWEAYLLTMVLSPKASMARAMRDFEATGDEILTLLR